MTIAARWKTLRARMKAQSQKGSAAIEFAFVAPVFFVLMLGTFEAAILFFSQAALENAVTDMARLIRTGQVQTGGMTQDSFRTQLCAKITPLIACDANLQIDIESYAGYSNLAYNSPLNSDKTINTGLTNFSTGNACDVVLVRAFYTWPVVTPVLAWFLVNMAGNKHLITAAAAFRNEPYTTTTGGC